MSATASRHSTAPAPPPSEADAPQEVASKKSYETILDQEVAEGAKELSRRSSGLLLSGISAGLDIGLSALVVAVIATASTGQVSAPVLKILMANAYAVGFIVVIFGRSELFTEHTTLAVLPVLAGKSSLRDLGRGWCVVYFANLLGATGFAALLAHIGPDLGVASPEALGEIAHHVVDHTASTIFLSAIMAGWMMGLVSWLVTAGRDTVGQIIFVWLVTSAIGLCGLHHCIVGTVEVLAGIFAGGDIAWSQFATFLACATTGNAVGGVVFVALLKFAHARRAKPLPVHARASHPRWGH